MNLYEINHEMEEAFMAAIDPETGEVVDEDALARLNQLAIDRDVKRENIALLIKNIKAEQEAIRAEKKNFEDRLRRGDRKLDWLQRYLQDDLAGEKISTTRVTVSYRQSKSIELMDGISLEDLEPRFIRAKLELDKTAAKEAIERGETVNGVVQVLKTNMIVK